ncbi:hypothetical protein, partial [Gluconobacter cerinus]|uniref:hypothetical protein n=1 Tax=Gluconobacter cerinus TaxID=38307 RepID=UPI0024E0AE92
GLRKIIPKPAAPKRRQHIPSNSIFNFQRSSSQPPRPDPRRRPRRVGERAYTATYTHRQSKNHIKIKKLAETLSDGSDHAAIPVSQLSKLPA